MSIRPKLSQYRFSVAPCVGVANPPVSTASPAAAPEDRSTDDVDVTVVVVGVGFGVELVEVVLWDVVCVVE